MRGAAAKPALHLSGTILVSRCTPKEFVAKLTAAIGTSPMPRYFPARDFRKTESVRYRMAENAICPICKSEAEAINVGLFDGVGVRCKTHGEFEVADSALAMHKDTEATRWEAALRSAKDRAKATQETWPRITTYDFR